MIVMQKWRFVYLLVKFFKKRFSGLLSQTQPCDSNICIVQQQQFWIENNKCTIWKHERRTQLSLFIQA